MSYLAAASRRSLRVILPLDSPAPLRHVLPRMSSGSVRPTIPDHELLRPIGHGSYGEVWLARNIMGAWRAVKIVSRESFDSSRPYEREFAGIKKFEPVSRAHDSQLDILHVGRDEAAGCFYYVMELADDVAHGQDIAPESYVPRTLRAELNARGRLPARECLDLGIALATALEHLHGHGLVHRDVKPSNVIFVNGRAKLADIGLVAGMDETMSFVGTEGYVPPEGPGSERGDLFSLGRVLYEMHTGYGREEFPDQPTALLPGEDAALARELNLIILKACAPDVERRQPSLTALREEMEMLKVGRSVERLRRAERRAVVAWRWAVVAGALAVASMLPYFSPVARSVERLWFLVNTRTLHVRTAERADGRPAPPPGSAETTPTGIFEMCDHARGEPLVASRLGYDYEEPVPPGMALHMDCRTGFTPEKNEYWPWSLDFSPDGALLAVVHFDGIRIFDTATGERLAMWPHRWCSSVKFLPDGRTLILSRSNGIECCAFDRLTAAGGRWVRIGKPRVREFGGPSFTHLTMTTDGEARRVVIPMRSGDLVLDSLDGSAPVRRFLHPADAAPALYTRGVVSSDGRWLAGCAATLQPPAVWSAKDGQIVLTQLHEWLGSIDYHFAFSPDSRLLAVASNRGCRIFETGSWREVRRVETIRPGYEWAAPLAFSADARVLAWRRHPTDVWLYDTATWRASLILSARNDVIEAFALSRDGGQCAFVTVGGQVLLYDLHRLRTAFARSLTRQSPPGAPPAPAEWSLAEELRPAADSLRPALPPRDKDATPAQLDLTEFYNARLDENFHSPGEPRGDRGLRSFAPGSCTLGGVRWDARGVVQLAGDELLDAPATVKGLPVRGRVPRVHFLHAAGWGVPPGEQVGSYIFHYADGSRDDFSLRFKVTIHNWKPKRDEEQMSGPARSVAWTGQNDDTAGRARVLALYKTTWENPHPEREVTSLDLNSFVTHAAPFIVAITVEEEK